MANFMYEAGTLYTLQNTALRAIYKPTGNVSPICSCNHNGTGIAVGNKLNTAYQSPVNFENAYVMPNYLLFGGVPYSYNPSIAGAQKES